MAPVKTNDKAGDFHPAFTGGTYSSNWSTMTYVWGDFYRKSNKTQRGAIIFLSLILLLLFIAIGMFLFYLFAAVVATRWHLCQDLDLVIDKEAPRPVYGVEIDGVFHPVYRTQEQMSAREAARLAARRRRSGETPGSEGLWRKVKGLVSKGVSRMQTLQTRLYGLFGMKDVRRGAVGRRRSSAWEENMGMWRKRSSVFGEWEFRGLSKVQTRVIGLFGKKDVGKAVASVEGGPNAGVVVHERKVVPVDSQGEGIEIELTELVERPAPVTVREERMRDDEEARDERVPSERRSI